MLLLIFELEGGRYAIETSQIAEIVPLVKLKKIPLAPDYVAGLMNYRGKPVPVVDLRYLAEGKQSVEKFSTRIILLNYQINQTREAILGLIAEQITETIKSTLSAPLSPGNIVDDYLLRNDSKNDGCEMIRWFDFNHMLPAHEIDMLF